MIVQSHRGPLRWGIIGTGYAAEQFATGLRTLGDANLQGVASRTVERANRFALVHAIPLKFSRYDELIDSDEIDIVYIGAVAPLHHELCMRAIAKNKPVLCEKPLCMKACEASEVLEASASNSCFVMEAMWSRFIPLMGIIRDVVNRGEIGSLRSVVADFGLRNTVDSNARLFDPREGGALRDLGVYPLSLAIQYLGPVDSAHFELRRGSTGADEHASGVVRFVSGATACIQADITSQTPSQACLIGTDGYIEIAGPIYRPTTAILTKTFAPQLAPVGSNMPAALPATLRRLAGAVKRRMRRGTKLHAGYQSNGYQYQATEVMRCVREGLVQSPIMPLSDSVEALRTIDLAYGLETVCTSTSETGVGS